MSIEPSPKSTITLHPSFSCAAEGEHQGGIVGCCYSCGELLCAAHIYHIPESPLFGDAAADGFIASPLACKSHAGEGNRQGLPREALLQPSKTDPAQPDGQKIRRRPKPKRPRPTGRRI